MCDLHTQLIGIPNTTFFFALEIPIQNLHSLKYIFYTILVLL